MMKKWNKYLAVIIIFAMLAGVASPEVSMAAAKVKLSSKKISVSVGKTKTLKLKNNKKKVKWKVVSGKKNIALKNKKKTSVKIVGKRVGSAKVQVKIGKKKYICKVTVVGKKCKAKVTNPPTSVTNPSNGTSVPVSGNSGWNTTEVPSSTATPVDDEKQNRVKVDYQDDIINEELREETDYEVSVNASGEVKLIVPVSDNISSIQMGDVAVFPSNSGTEDGAGVVVKVDSITINDNGEYVILGSKPELSEVFETIDIDTNAVVDMSTFTYNPEVIEEEVTSSVNDSLKKAAIGEDHTFNLKERNVGEYGRFKGDVTIKAPEVSAKVNADFSGLIPVITEVDFNVKEEVSGNANLTFTNSNATGNDGFNEYLGHAYAMIGASGFIVDVWFYLDFSAEGEATVQTQITDTLNIHYQNGGITPNHDCDISFDGTKSEVSGQLLFNPQIGLRYGGIWSESKHDFIFGIDIVKAEADIGPGLKSSSVVYDTIPYVCTNINIYAYATASLNTDSGIGEILKSMHSDIDTNWTFLDNNSRNPLRYTWHYEDGERIYETCSHGTLSEELDQVDKDSWDSMNENEGNEIEDTNILTIPKPYFLSGCTIVNSLKMGGVIYENAIQISLDSDSHQRRIGYNLQGLYDQVSFEIGHIDETGVANENIKLTIFEDGVEKSFYNLNVNDIPKKIRCDVTNVKQFEIVVDYDYITGVKGSFGIGNIQFEKSNYDDNLVTKLYSDFKNVCMPYLLDGGVLVDRIAMGGVIYENAIQISLDSDSHQRRIGYNLQGLYDQVSFEIGHIDETGVANENIKLTIFEDGVEKSFYNLNVNDIPKKIRCDVTNVKQFEIVVDYDYITGVKGSFGIGNIKFNESSK